MLIKTLSGIVCLFMSLFCYAQKFDCVHYLDICTAKIKSSMEDMNDVSKSPRNIPSGERKWKYVASDDWTAGYYPGLLWYAYEYSADPDIRLYAEKFTKEMERHVCKIGNHDLGIMTYASIGNAYRITGQKEYADYMIMAATKLSELYNPNVKTICSWPYMKEINGWPHNTIIDNMINIELLFKIRTCSDAREAEAFYDIAYNHAKTTAENHFRKNGSTYHVVIYDDKNGRVLKKITHQGNADESMWARGQAWAIYGFTMAYRDTGDKFFLKTAMKAADIYISRLPSSYIPYWDFDDPDIPESPKDASAAAITASALIELSSLCPSNKQGKAYLNAGIRILESLSSPEYFSDTTNDAILLHCTGHKPHGSEIDASIIYGDYYYMEALMRLYRMEKRPK